MFAYVADCDARHSQPVIFDRNELRYTLRIFEPEIAKNAVTALIRYFSLFALIPLFMISPHADAEILTSRENGFTVSVPDSWELFPVDILRIREELAKEVLGTRVGYEFGLQAPGATKWESIPYVYVTIHRYSDSVVGSRPTPKEWKQLLESSYAKNVLVEIGDLIKDGLDFDEDNSFSVSIDEMFQNLRVVYDESRKIVYEESTTNSPEHGPLRMWSVSYFGRFANVRIDFFSSEATVDKWKKTRNGIFNSFRFLSGSAYGDESKTETPSPTTRDELNSRFRWPKAFRVSPSTILDGDYGLFYYVNDKDASDNIMAAYAFCLGQEITAEVLKQRYPQYAPALTLTQSRFERQFSPATLRIEALYDELGVSSMVTEQLRPAEEFLRKQNYSASDAEAFLEEIENRITGGIPSPMLDALLLFHPIYQKEPHLEIDHGFKKEFSADGSGKARGLKISIQHPTTWASTEGRRPHILRNFRNLGGFGRSSIAIVVNPLPEGSTADEYDSITSREYASAISEGLSTHPTWRFELVDMGQCLLQGSLPTGWSSLGQWIERGLLFPLIW